MYDEYTLCFVACMRYAQGGINGEYASRCSGKSMWNDEHVGKRGARAQRDEDKRAMGVINNIQVYDTFVQFGKSKKKNNSGAVWCMLFKAWTSLVKNMFYNLGLKNCNKILF